MILLDSFQIPEQFRIEIDSLSFRVLNLVFKELTKVITCEYDYTFESPFNTSPELDLWIQSLTNKEIIKLSFYILYVIDNQTDKEGYVAIS